MPSLADVAVSRGRLLHITAIPATAWLHDQLEDLAYAADSGAWPASKWLGE
jgi:hypothetical protein